MKFLIWMKTNLLRQKTLYFWFVFIMLLPALALSLTEPLSIWVRIAAVLLPAGCYMILFNLFRKPGYFLLISFILLLINGYQLVLIYLFSESVVSPDMFLNIMTTDAGESGELMRTIWPAVLLACILYFSATAMGIYSVINPQKLPRYFTKRTCIIAMLPLVGGFISLGINHAKGFPFRADHAIYPVNVLYNLNFAVNKYIRTIKYPVTSAGFTFDASKSESASQREVVLLIIGETTRAANWELYGYPRPTNPQLSKRDDILLYKDVLTQANITHKLVPMMLSSACAEDFSTLYSQKSITTAFREAGYHTVYISNQIHDRAFIDAFASEADSTIFIPDLRKHDRHPFDSEAVPIVESMIRSTEGPLFIIFHSYGSHFQYSHRYPQDKAFFKPDQAGALRYKERAVFMNAYDNSVRGVDEMINSMIEVLNDSALCSSMLYVSDHGEDLMDDERKMFLHCSPVPTYYQLHVPMVLWFSPEYRQNFPDTFQAAMENRDKPVSSARSIFHTVLDMGQVETSYRDNTLSVVNPDFLIQKRHFIDEHDEPIDFYSIGLKQRDWQMIEKMNLRM